MSTAPESNIIDGPRVRTQTAKALGFDTSELASTSRPGKDGANRKQDASHKQTTLQSFQKDAKKPDGEAVGRDGNLLREDQISWLHSPSEDRIGLPDVDQHVGGSSVSKAVVVAGSRSTKATVNAAKRRSHPTGEELPQKRQRTSTSTSRPSVGSRINAILEQDDDLESSTAGEGSNAEDDVGDGDDDDAVNGEGDGEGDDEGDGEDEELREEDMDEGEKAYWAQNELDKNKERRRKSAATKDLRLFYKQNVRKVNGTPRRGAYCTLCLKNKVSEKNAFLTGNATALRKHLSRKHYKIYLERCELAGVKAKAHAPNGWKGKTNNEQQKIDGYTVARDPVIPPFQKEGLVDYLVEFIVDTDQPFLIVERQSLRRLILYLRRKSTDEDIPKRTCIASAIAQKVKDLVEIDRELIKRIVSRISVTFDGWSRRRRQAYSSFTIHWIEASPDNPNKWILRSQLLAFDRTLGRHTGAETAKVLLNVIDKYEFRDRLGWFVSDNVNVNDSAVRHACTEIDPFEIELVPKERRGRCIEHTVHLMAGHFVIALKLPSSAKAKRQVHGAAAAAREAQQDAQSDSGSDDADEGEDENSQDLDVDVDTAIEATPDDADAIAGSSVTDFEPGDVIGKIFAFIAQVRKSDQAMDYLMELCISQGCGKLELKTWVRTRWGSVSHCFERSLTIRKAMDVFCVLADGNDNIPDLTHGKHYADFKLTSQEWSLIELALVPLKLAADTHSQLSAERVPTIQKVYPIIERLQSQWEALRDDPAYSMIKIALSAGLKNMAKWYRATNDTPIYFISHVLDPTRKLSYLEITWTDGQIEKAKSRMKKEYMKYSERTTPSNERPEVPSTATVNNGSAADSWMDELIAKTKRRPTERVTSRNPAQEVDDWFDSPLVPRAQCPDIIEWFGYHQLEWPVISLMARDYLAIPGSAVPSERVFSKAGLTDADPRRGRLGSKVFAGLQMLKGAYQDGRLVAREEAWMRMGPSFKDYEESAPTTSLTDEEIEIMDG